jgi:predicted Zn-dependent protease
MWESEPSVLEPALLQSQVVAMHPPSFGRLAHLWLTALFGLAWLVSTHEVAWSQNPKTPFDNFFENFMRMTPRQRAELQEIEVPWKVEQDQGRQTFESYRRYLQNSGITLSDSNPDARYVQTLAARVHPHMKHARRYRQLNVYIAESGEVDARSIPGGYLIFHRGLLEFAESEAALVGIIGHELSHLDRGHQMKPIRQMIRAQNQLARADRLNPGDFISLGQNMMNSFHPFHPEEEEEADQDGIEWMHRIGYDARELARLFRHLGERPRRGAAAGMPAFLRTHPLFPDRAATTLRYFQRLQRTSPREDLVVGREALTKRIPATMPKKGRDK